MTDKKSKLSFRESLGLLGFGFKTAHNLLPAYYPCVVLRSLVTAAQPVLVLFFSARILNELTGAGDRNRIILYASLTVGLTFALSVIKAFIIREIETHAGREQALKRLHMLQAERFATMDFSHTEDSSVSEILARMDIHARGSSRGMIKMFIAPDEASNSLFTMIFAVILLLAGGLPAAADSDSASIWASAALGVLFVAGIIIGLHLQTREKNIMLKIVNQASETNTLANYYSNYIDADQAAKDLRIYGQKRLLRGILEKSFDARPWISFMFFEGKVSSFRMGMLAVISGGVYLLTGYGALGGAIPVGEVVRTVGAVSMLAAATGALISQLGVLFNNAPFIKPMRDYLNLPDILHKGAKPVPPPDARGYRFEFRNVSFKYPGSEDYALRDLNLSLIPGERLAIVGLNGSGKTTMVKLLCRLYDPTEGEILLDGVNIKEFDYEQYTALFSVVFQDFMLFPLWLSQNIAANTEYDEQRLRECIENAGFAGRLDTMPEGLDTILYKNFDENGTQVSGGEAQKLALARALYKNAPVVILDEPTAALDPIAEYEVYTTFDNTIGDKTVVFISHRLSSCRFCQRVAVFEGGRLIQLGSHEKLLAEADGRYHELWEAQASHYRDETGNGGAVE